MSWDGGGMTRYPGDPGEHRAGQIGPPDDGQGDDGHGEHRAGQIVHKKNPPGGSPGGFQCSQRVD